MYVAGAWARRVWSPRDCSSGRANQEGAVGASKTRVLPTTAARRRSKAPTMTRRPFTCSRRLPSASESSGLQPRPPSGSSICERSAEPTKPRHQFGSRHGLHARCGWTGGIGAILTSPALACSLCLFALSCGVPGVHSNRRVTKQDARTRQGHVGAGDRTDGSTDSATTDGAVIDGALDAGCSNARADCGDGLSVGSYWIVPPGQAPASSAGTFDVNRGESHAHGQRPGRE